MHGCISSASHHLKGVELLQCLLAKQTLQQSREHLHILPLSCKYMAEGK